MSRTSSLPLGLFLLLSACEAQVGGPLGANPSAGGMGNGTAGAAGIAGNTSGGSGTSSDCASGPQAAAVGLALLTESQFNNSVQDILQASATQATGLGQGLDDVSLEQRANAAATIAAQAATNLSKWAPCTPPATGDATPCARQIIDKAGALLYRRPLQDAERTAMTALFDAGLKEKNFANGVELLLTGLLQSPYFVYQVVRPAASEVVGEVRPLSAHEYATRLAYFMWDGPPDEALATAAANDDFVDATKRDAQIGRMLKDQRFLRGVTQFYTRWLKLGAFAEVARDVPAFDESVVKSLTTSLLMSATELYKADNANIKSLFSGDSYYFNDTLGKFYGAPASGSSFAPVSLANQARSGILTHPALMALLARSDESFPIGRGLFMLRNVVCKVVPALPADFVPPQQPPLQEGTSTRTRLETHTGSAACQACHGMINPSGFIFESFDEVGRYRTMDHGAPVNSGVTLKLDLDVDGTYATGAELLAKLGDSPAVRACFAEKYMNFAVAHADTSPADTCSVQAVGKSFGATGDLKQLVSLVAASDSFRMRLAEGVGK